MLDSPTKREKWKRTHVACVRRCEKAPLRDELLWWQPQWLFFALVAISLLCGERANGEVSDRDARRIRQVVEAGRANYLAFDNFVCRLRIRVGRAASPSSTSAPQIKTVYETAEARWVRKGKNQFYEIFIVEAATLASSGEEFATGGYLADGIYVLDDQYAMVRSPAREKQGRLVQLSVSDDIGGVPMEMLHTWNTYGYMYNERGIISVYLAEFLARYSDREETMVDYSVVRQNGRKLEKVTLDLGGQPPIRNTVWIDPARGYLGARNSWQTMIGSQRFHPQRIGVIVESRQFGPRWFPWKSRSYYTDTGTDVVTCFETEVLELKLGAARDTDFAVALPKGAIVRLWDSSGRQSVLDSPRRVRLDEVPRLLAETSALPGLNASREVVVRKDRSRWWKWGLIGTGAVLLVGGLCLRLLRK